MKRQQYFVIQYSVAIIQKLNEYNLKVTYQTDECTMKRKTLK